MPSVRRLILVPVAEGEIERGMGKGRDSRRLGAVLLSGEADDEEKKGDEKPHAGIERLPLGTSPSLHTLSVYRAPSPSSSSTYQILRPDHSCLPYTSATTVDVSRKSRHLEFAPCMSA